MTEKTAVPAEQKQGQGHEQNALAGVMQAIRDQGEAIVRIEDQMLALIDRVGLIERELKNRQIIAREKQKTEQPPYCEYCGSEFGHYSKCPHSPDDVPKLTQPEARLRREREAEQRRKELLRRIGEQHDSGDEDDGMAVA